MPSSHRRLVHRHAQRILSGTPRDLAPGEARLFSYYAPSLTGGLHSVTVSQHIEAPPEPGSGSSARRSTDIEKMSQSFIVIAPRFSLAPGVVDSVYPTPGTSVEHTILPHITFKDAHLPWSRAPSHTPKDYDKDNFRSRSTWLALVVFSVDELQLTKEQIAKVMQKLPVNVDREQTETLSLQMRAKDTVDLSGIDGVVNTTGFNSKLDARDATEPTGVVLLTGSLFADLFVEPGGPTDRLHVGGYKHLAHVRKIATDGMANAGSEEDEAYFSVVVSRRCGPIDAPEPSMMVVHLLSLCWDTAMPFPKPSDRVAVTSLHSWTYTCLASENVASTFDLLVNLGSHLTVLRTDQAQEKAPKPLRDEHVQDDDNDTLRKLIAARQKDGYTIARHRTITGEITASILRGPLSPTQVDHPFSSNMCMQSNFGSDLAIFDPKLGLLDNTYANAWQLGRTLAMGDNAFCAALARLRNSVQGAGLDGAKREVHAALGDDGFGTRRRAADRMVDLVKGLNGLNASLHAEGARATATDINRWCYDGERDEGEGIGVASIDLLSQNSPHIVTRLAAHSNAAAQRFAMATESFSDNQGIVTHSAEEVLYNEYNNPLNPDFAQVYSWVLDKVHLGNVPAHYLIPDPAFLSQETLRFFYLDANWADALIDGALSLANHWGAAPEKDTSRTAIKEAINKRLRTPDAALGGWHVPMPRYGFLLRSQLLVQFPDLAIDVKFAASRSQPVDDGAPCTARAVPPANTPARQPILVQKRIAPDTMYLLFDAGPPDLRRITFTMPSHQQCFRLGQTLTSDVLTVMLKRIYTSNDRPLGAKPGDTLHNVNFLPNGKTNNGKLAPVFNWQSRLVDPTMFGQYLIGELRDELKEYFTDQEPTSAVTGLQLNDPILQLDIGDVSAESASNPVTPFQLSTPLAVNGSSPPPVVKPSRLQVARGGLNRRSRSESPTRDAQLLAQYRRSQQSETNTLTASSSPPKQEARLAPPSYTLRVYHVRGKSRTFIPSNSPDPIDLVFSLRQTFVNQWTRLLTRILVGVPVGEVPADVGTNPKAFIPLLAKTADPPNPVMLSNLRLNVLKRWGQDDDDDFKGHIIFELVPRQQPGVLVRYLEDASFRLPRAKIAQYDGTTALRAYVKVLYEFLSDDGVPERASFKNGQFVQMKPA